MKDKNKLSPELEVSPYETTDKRYVDGKIQSVTYHNTDWWKCFHPNISDETFTDAVRGFCMENIDCSFPEAILVLQCMSDKDITGYADFFNTTIDRCNDYLRCAYENTRSM